MKDFSITTPATFPAGDIAFGIQNDGPSAHEFVIIRTDDAPDAFPVENGEIPEDQVDLVDEAEDIAPGTDTSLSANLTAGSYVLVCNLPRTTGRGCTRRSPSREPVTLSCDDTRRRSPAALRENACAQGILGELTALNLQSIFRSGPALAAGSVRKRIEARSLGTTA